MEDDEDGDDSETKNAQSSGAMKFKPFVLEMMIKAKKKTTSNETTVTSTSVTQPRTFYVCATHHETEIMNEIVFHPPFVIENLLYCPLSISVMAGTNAKAKKKRCGRESAKLKKKKKSKVVLSSRTHPLQKGEAYYEYGYAPGAILNITFVLRGYENTTHSFKPLTLTGMCVCVCV